MYSRRLGRDLKNGSNDFSETLHVVRYPKNRKRSTAGFLKKTLDHPISAKTCHFRQFFGLFSKSRIEILVLKRQNVVDYGTKQTQKTAALILFKKSRYLSSKSFIDGPKSRKSSIFCLYFSKFLSSQLEKINKVNSDLLLHISIKGTQRYCIIAL